MTIRPRATTAALAQRVLVTGLVIACVPLDLAAQSQVVDTAFRPPLHARTYRPGAGPVVTVDEAHHNFHTIGGRYRPFASLLEADGFTLRAGRAPISAASLEGTDVLVVSNALDARNVAAANWRLPAYSAFNSRMGMRCLARPIPEPATIRSPFDAATAVSANIRSRPDDRRGSG